MENLVHASVILLCMAIAAFLSGIETGVISIDRMRLRHFVRRNAKWAKILQSFLDNSDRLFGTTLVGTNLSMVVISVVGASLAVKMAGVTGEIVSTAALSVLVLIFSEFIPKAWFRSSSLEKCRRFAVILQGFEVFLRPLYTGVIAVSRFLVRDTRRADSQSRPFVTKDDLVALAKESEKTGILTGKESVMINRVLELTGKTAGNIMIPIEKVVFAYNDAGIEELCDIVRKSGFTRIPVMEREKKQFIGVVNVFDVLSAGCEKKTASLADHIRPPLFVTEDTPVDQILPKARRLRQPMCLVVRKHGEVVGLVTSADILGKVVGSV